MSVGHLPNDMDLRKLRSVPARYAVLGAAIIGSPMVGGLLGRFLTTVFAGSGQDLIINIGTVAGAGLGFIGFMAMKHRFFVSNPTTGVFLTIDTLKAFLSRDDIFVGYGPGGPHPAFPWEKRVPENNISVKVATVTFTVSIQCQDGTVTVSGSARLRPDHMNVQAFLTGVATTAADLQDLILSFLISKIGRKKIADVLKGITTLNTNLKKKFVGHDANTRTEFEEQHGVYVNDVTVSEILPSAEVQRTMSGITEARFVAEGTAILLGYETAADLSVALKAGQLTNAERDNARMRFMAMTGNMEGVNVNRFEIDLNASGIDKDTAEALTSLARNTPPGVLAGMAAAFSKKAKTK